MEKIERNDVPVMAASGVEETSTNLSVRQIMQPRTLYTTKKALYYNFFPTKEEEEDMIIKSHGVVFPPTYSLVEIRDVLVPAVPEPGSPWTIKKKINCYEITAGNMVLRFNDVFEHVLRHWPCSLARPLVERGTKFAVALLDVTEEKRPKRYEDTSTMYLQMLGSKDFSLACLELMKDRKLQANMEIFLYWDAKDSQFCFKLSS